MSAFDSLPRSEQEIKAESKKFNLNPFREHFAELRILKQEADLAKKKYELFRDRLKARIGDADELEIDGQVVATHAVNGAFNVSKLKKEQPHLHDPYLVVREVEVFDEDRFAADHPYLYNGDAFRHRTLRFK